LAAEPKVQMLQEMAAPVHPPLPGKAQRTHLRQLPAANVVVGALSPTPTLGAYVDRGS
jgi:hypothetical protein